MTGTLNNAIPARDIAYDVVQYLKTDVAYNTSGIGSSDTVKLGVIPAGAQIINCAVAVKTAFNAATTNVLTVGTSSGSNADVVGASDVTEGSIGGANVATGQTLSFTSDTTIYVKYTQSGTAATAGAATIVLSYVV
jgi:hypothetical protein